MCGLFGNTHPLRISLETSRAALHTLTHRGPDQWGEWHDENIYIGHRRLSILDLSERGRQPMTDSTASVIISVNGEIYNYPALRKQLEVRHEFQSHSDSEVVIHGYKEWGLAGLLERIDGMYAISIYDRAQGKIILVRDRAGIKPVYYGQINGVFAWASELKAIREFFGRDKLSIDHTALYDFLTYLYVPAPKSLYRNVCKLEPGHVATYCLDTGTLDVHAYWRLEPDEQPISVEDAGSRLRQLVDRSVQEQLMSDVPVGVFLSGGMDSSIIAESANRFSSHIKTFTIQVDESTHDESPDARKLADFLGTDHYVRTCALSDANELMHCLEDWYDEPFADTSAIPTHLVSKFSRELITVALSGDGGDELFGGYRWYYAMRDRSRRRRESLGRLRPLSRKLKQLAGKTQTSRLIRRLEFDHVLDDLEYYTRLMGGSLREDKLVLAKDWGIDPEYDDYWYFRKFWKSNLPLLTRLQYLDFHTYLPDDILTKVDRASMQVALEVRVPFLSREIIEYSFSLPESVRYDGERLKGLLKNAYASVLPAAILNKPKQGFSIPLKNWKMADGSLASIQEQMLMSYDR